MKTLDLNCDMGELSPDQERNFDAEIMPYITSCNIACGGHSGTPVLMKSTIQAAKEHQVNIGAHPSYPDRVNFGRVSMKIDPEQLMDELHQQITLLKNLVEKSGQTLHHVKPHGALYHDMNQDISLAQKVVELIQQIDPSLKIYALANSLVMDVCANLGMKCIGEGFADRRYQSSTQLRSRKFEDAVLTDTADIFRQIDHFLEGKVEVYSSEIHPVKIETLCLHSDTTGAVELSRQIHAYLTQKNVILTAHA